MDSDGELADLAGQNGQVDGADRRHLGLCLDRFDRASHAIEAIGKSLAQRPQLAAVVRQLRQAFVEDRHRIEDTLEVALKVDCRRFRPFGTGCRHRHQMAGEIAAIDGGNVQRIERLQRRRVIPVEEMAALTRHALDSRHRRVDAGGGVGQADPAEIARRNH